MRVCNLWGAVPPTMLRITAQTGKYVVRAEDLQRAEELPCTQRPIKRAEFEKYSCQARRRLQKGIIAYVEAR